MMPVAPLVVHPGQRIAVGLALGRVGAAAALKIPHAREKLGRGVLGKVVRQPLPDQPHPEAAAHDQMPVVRDGLQMSPEFVHSCRLLFSYPIIR